MADKKHKMDWKARCCDVGTAVLVAGIAEGVHTALVDVIERAHACHFAVGLGKGACAVAGMLLGLGQLAICIVLCVPRFYRTTGAVLPALALALALVVETVLTGDANEPLALLRLLLNIANAIVLGAVRVDRAALKAQLQLPSDDVIDRLEKHLRAAVTRVRSGLWCPVAAVLLLQSAAARAGGRGAANPVAALYTHLEFQALLPAAALTLLLAAADRRGDARFWRAREFVVGARPARLHDLLGRRRKLL